MALSTWTGPSVYETGASGDELVTRLRSAGVRPTMWTAGVGSFLRTMVALAGRAPGTQQFVGGPQAVLAYIDEDSRLAALADCGGLRERYVAKLVSFGRPGIWDLGGTEGFSYQDELDYGVWLRDRWTQLEPHIWSLLRDGGQDALGEPHAEIGGGLLTTVHEGGLMALWRWANGDTESIAVRIEADGSPVTEVDLQVNDEVVARISERYRADAVRGEERDHGNAESSRQWICDPLDGTSAFVLGVPTSVFMLALAVEGVLELAVVRDPFSGREYIASAGEGAFCDDAPIQVSGDGLRDGCVVLGSDSFLFAQALKRSGARLAAVPGSGYKAMMIARGVAVATIRSSADIHDLAPAALIVHEAGGRVSGLDGSPILLDRAPGGVIVSNRETHSALIDIAASVRTQ
jgi:fructose-1,6-bisphosphatase/inositol monophosphatase family enzyme